MCASVVLWTSVPSSNTPVSRSPFPPQTSKYLASARPLYTSVLNIFLPLLLQQVRFFSEELQIFGLACRKLPKLLNCRTEFTAVVPQSPKRGKSLPNPRNGEAKGRQLLRRWWKWKQNNFHRIYGAGGVDRIQMVPKLPMYTLYKYTNTQIIVVEMNCTNLDKCKIGDIHEVEDLQQFSPFWNAGGPPLLIPLLTIELRRRRYIPLLEAGQDNTEQMTHQSSGREDAVWAVVVHCTMGLHCKAVKRNEGKGNGSSSSMAERGE